MVEAEGKNSSDAPEKQGKGKKQKAVEKHREELGNSMMMFSELVLPNGTILEHWRKNMGWEGVPTEENPNGAMEPFRYTGPQYTTDVIQIVFCWIPIRNSHRNLNVIFVIMCV